MPSSFSARLMNKWHRYTEVNKSAQEYVEKFDEFLIRCNALNTEVRAQILPRFRAELREDLRAELREDLRTELLAREITKHKKAYTLVQDLDVVTVPPLRATLKQPNSPRVSTLTPSKDRLQRTRWILKARVLRIKTRTLTKSPQTDSHNQMLQVPRIWICSGQLLKPSQNCFS